MGKNDPLVVKYKDLLELLNALPASKKSKFLHGAPNTVINLIAEIFKNLLRENIPIPPSHIKKLKRGKDLIRSVALKKTSLTSKKKLLCSRRGGGLLATIIPLALSAVKSIFGL